jgi:hypothetical protein
MDTKNQQYHIKLAILTAQCLGILAYNLSDPQIEDFFHHPLVSSQYSIHTSHPFSYK